MAANLRDVLALVGRIALATLFIKEGVHQIIDFSGTGRYMAAAGLPMVNVLLVLTILIEAGGGIAIALGWKARWAALAFAIWLVPVTVVFHNPWSGDAQTASTQTIHLLKNLSIFGGMLLLAAFGPGRYSLEREQG